MPTSPSTSHFTSRLPPEIIDLIVEDKNLDSSDICTISLVSYDWKDPSQCRLFNSIRLDPEKDHPLFTLTPNSDNVRLIGYIKHLTLFSTSPASWKPFPCDSAEDAQIRIEDDPEQDDDDDDYYFNTSSSFIGTPLGATRLDLIPDPEATNFTHPNFPIFLHLLSKLEMLTVRNRLNWYLLPRDVVQAFFHIFNLKTFHHLDLWRGSGIRLPFIFLHFCPNLEYLSLNVWPTAYLEPIGIDDSNYRSLGEMPTVRPTTLKMISGEVVHAVNHYVDMFQKDLDNCNSISFDRLRALYIAYDEDPCSHIVPGKIWPSHYVGDFLFSFGRNLEELVLEVDHRIAHRPTWNTSPYPDLSISTANLSNLKNLKNLCLNVYNGPLPQFNIDDQISWVLPFLAALPNPSQLTTFQVLYVSRFEWTTDFDHLITLGEAFLEHLFDVLNLSFSGLKAIKVQMKLTMMNGSHSPDHIFPAYALTSRCDYTGLVALKSGGVHTRFRVVINTESDDMFR